MRLYGEMGINKYREMNYSRLKKGIKIIQREGFLIFGYRFMHYTARYFLKVISPLAIKIIPKGYFQYKDQKLEYLRHKKNLAWTNERTIEVPIVMNHVLNYTRNFPDSKVLEIGAVLPHYYPNFKHTVVDKFEEGAGIINEDVITFSPKEKYDLIVSISTLEHVGFEDDIKDPEGILKAIKNLRENCLDQRGKMVITLPLGYNKNVDRYIFGGKLGFSEEYFFEKKNIFNRWEEISKEESKEIKFDTFNAKGIIVGITNPKLK